MRMFNAFYVDKLARDFGDDYEAALVFFTWLAQKDKQSISKDHYGQDIGLLLGSSGVDLKILRTFVVKETNHRLHFELPKETRRWYNAISPNIFLRRNLTLQQKAQYIKAAALISNIMRLEYLLGKTKNIAINTQVFPVPEDTPMIHMVPNTNVITFPHEEQLTKKYMRGITW